MTIIDYCLMLRIEEKNPDLLVQDCK